MLQHRAAGTKFQGYMLKTAMEAHKGNKLDSLRKAVKAEISSLSLTRRGVPAGEWKALLPAVLLARVEAIVAMDKSFFSG